MTQPFRLAQGGRIDRARKLRFTFDGRALEGHPGDTLASALLANGTHLVGRSFKYHRPRGIFAAGSDEPSALVTLGGDPVHRTPNLRATQVELFEGLVAESQNRFPSLGFDIGALNDLASPILPAGFYYKTFLWPSGAWKRLYEPMIRAMAGLGRAPSLPDPSHYAQRYAHCDVLVVGAGPAGLAAALAAAAAGARVILCDEQAELGGSLLAAPDASVEGVPAYDWIAAATAELRGNARVTLLPRATGFGYFAYNFVGLAERLSDHLAAPDANLPRERLWQVRAREVVLATGALERPLVFPGNDRPGVMLSGAALTYAARYGVRPGATAAVATNCDQGYRAALALSKLGMRIAAIADWRASAEGPAAAVARAAGLPIHPRTVIAATSGRLRIRSARLGRIDGSTVKPGAAVSCDLLLVAGGRTPAVHLFSQSRGKLAFDESLQAFVPGESVQRERSAGACRGRYALADAIEDGYAAGAAAAKATRGGTAPARALAVTAPLLAASERAEPVRHGWLPPRAKAFVDLQNDVTVADLRLATREGFKSIEHVKRYTTAGMATDQGKTSNMNALGIVGEALGKAPAEVGTTTFRMPYTPTGFGTLAGLARGGLYDPMRRTPMHAWARERGAVFEDVGWWKRASYFPRAGEDKERAVARECLAVRRAVGLFDASTLGKIEVVGRDAARFLNWIYVNDFAKLRPGRCRYGIMLREDGVIADDGVIGRLAEDRFHVTTTTGGIAHVLHAMEDYLQTELTGFETWLTPTTEQWAVIAVQGPRARDVLARLVDGIDISAAAMPHMSVREGTIRGVPVRLFRVSFTGELGFEVNVPADYGAAVCQAIWEAGQAFGIAPYGMEALHILRAEKGYIIGGQDTEGITAPDDVGLGWAIGRAKENFLGKRSLDRPQMQSPDRKQLVGLRSEDGKTVLEEGAQIVADPRQRKPMTVLGHVTSSYWSAALDRPIALAMVKGGRGRMGEALWVPLRGSAARVRIESAVFYDPEGARLDG